MVYELLLGGVLASVLVPLLVRARKQRRRPRRGVHPAAAHPRRARLGRRDRARGGLRAAAHRALASGSGAATTSDLITTLSYLMLPMIFFYGMAALFGAMLNTRGHFAAPMWTPILNNIVVIATCGVFIVVVRGRRRPQRRARDRRPDRCCSAAARSLGIVVQAVGLLPALRKVGLPVARGGGDFRELRPARAGPASAAGCSATSWSASSA